MRKIFTILFTILFIFAITSVCSADVKVLGDEEKVIWYNGDYYFSLRASGSMAANFDYIWPPSGNSGQVIATNGYGTLSFVDVNAVAGIHELLAVTHTDAAGATISAGDIIYGNSTPKWDALGIGDTNEILLVSGGYPDWQNKSFLYDGLTANRLVVTDAAKALASSAATYDPATGNINMGVADLIFSGIGEDVGVLQFVNSAYGNTAEIAMNTGDGHFSFYGSSGVFFGPLTANGQRLGDLGFPWASGWITALHSNSLTTISGDLSITAAGGDIDFGDDNIETTGKVGFGVGSVSAPGLYISGSGVETNCGFRRKISNNWTWVAGGVDILDFSSYGIIFPNGSAAAPSMTFIGEDAEYDTGIFWIADNRLGFSANEAEVLELNTTGAEVTGNISSTGAITGVNVTSGADPGHTHTGASLGSIDISDDTNLVAGTNITLVDDTLNVDDAFLKNNANDETTGLLKINTSSVTALWVEDDGTKEDVLVVNTVDGTVTLGDSSQLATSAAPTADADIANKKYVDDQIAAGVVKHLWTPWMTTGPGGIWTPSSGVGGGGKYACGAAIANTEYGLTTIRIPDDYISVVSCKIGLLPDDTDATANYDIGLWFSKTGEDFEGSNTADVASTYSVTADTFFEIDIAAIFTSGDDVVAGDFVGVKFLNSETDNPHNVRLIGIYLSYNGS